MAPEIRSYPIYYTRAGLRNSNGTNLIMEPTGITSTESRGRCLCGAVSIKIGHCESVLRTMACHCTHCQKGAGGPFQTNAVFHKDDIQIIDPGQALKTYSFPGTDVTSGSPKEKCFCGVRPQSLQLMAHVEIAMLT